MQTKMQANLLKIEFVDYLCRIKAKKEEDELGEIVQTVTDFLEYLEEKEEETE